MPCQELHVLPASEFEAATSPRMGFCPTSFNKPDLPGIRDQDPGTGLPVSKLLLPAMVVT